LGHQEKKPKGNFFGSFDIQTNLSQSFPEERSR
jgi:hypothetical protein